MRVGRARYAARVRVGAVMGTAIIDNTKSPRCKQDLWNAGSRGPARRAPNGPTGTEDVSWRSSRALVTLQPSHIHPRSPRPASDRQAGAGGQAGGRDFLHVITREARPSFRGGHTKDP